MTDPTNQNRKLGLALVGLGHYASDRLAPALEQSECWRLTAIVTGSPSKIPAWQTSWAIQDDHVFHYDNFDRIAECEDVDAVYICLPNSLHLEFTLRAARAGKHVIVEKPIATSVEDAEQMIAACKAAGVKLAVGYRLRFNRLHQYISKGEAVTKSEHIHFINAIFSIDVGAPEQWRLRKNLSGGGALIDVGIYCVQAARYITGREPLSVTAQFGPVTDTNKFAEVEEHISWQMRFPGNVYMTGYAGYSRYIDELCVSTSETLFKLEPAFSYGPLRGEVRDNAAVTEISIPHEHHQWKQLEEMGRLFQLSTPLPRWISGEEGLTDLKILTAIYQAARSGEEIHLPSEN